VNAYGPVPEAAKTTRRVTFEIGTGICQELLLVIVFR
jgi:hypothetical protein